MTLKTRDLRIAPAMMSARETANVLLLTPRRVQQLVGEGVLPAAVAGRYATGPVISAYLAFLRNAPSRVSTASDASRSLAAAREAQVRAGMAREAAELLPRDEVIAFVNLIGEELMRRTEALADGMAPLPRQRWLTACAGIRADVARLIATGLGNG